MSSVSSTNPSYGESEHTSNYPQGTKPNSLPKNSGNRRDTNNLSENARSDTANNSGSVLSYIASNPATSLARGLCIGVGGTLYGVSMVVNCSISLVFYLPTVVAGGLGAGIGYAIDCMCGSKGEDGAPGPATTGLAFTFGVLPFLGGGIAACNPASAAVRGCISLVGLAGAGLLAAGIEAEGSFDTLCTGLLISTPDLYLKLQAGKN
jgi:hypothetical protein